MAVVNISEAGEQLQWTSELQGADYTPAHSICYKQEPTIQSQNKASSCMLYASIDGFKNQKDDTKEHHK